MNKLPTELVVKICSHISYADKMDLYLSRSCSMPNPLVEFAEEFLPFTWESLSFVLSETNATIGGSMALRFFSNPQFEPGDLDIYGEIEHIPVWQRFFTAHGFVEDNEAGFDGFYAERGFRVQEFKRGDMTVQYVCGVKLESIDNTANLCTIASNKAICPYFNHVFENKTVFSRNMPSRIEKMRDRGFEVTILKTQGIWSKLRSLFQFETYKKERVVTFYLIDPKSCNLL